MKKLCFIMTILMVVFPNLGLAENNGGNAKAEKAAVAAGFTGAGAAVGYGATVVAGVSAVGVVGSGAGIGAAAGPIGAAVGALVGLAAYGVYSIVKP